MCNCIAIATKRIQDEMLKQYSPEQIMENASVTNTELIFGEKDPVLTIFGRGRGTLRIENRVKVFHLNLKFTYCPFCGKKYSDN